MRQALRCILPSAAYITDARHPDGRPTYEAKLPGDTPVRLSSPRGDRRFDLTVRQLFTIQRIGDDEPPEWEVAVTGYQYSIDDDDGREILAYHWHPLVGFATPHVHLSSAAGTLRQELQSAHLPTGYVPFADVVLLLIRDFNVKARQDYRSVLERARAST